MSGKQNICFYIARLTSRDYRCIKLIKCIPLDYSCASFGVWTQIYGCCKIEEKKKCEQQCRYSSRVYRSRFSFLPAKQICSPSFSLLCLFIAHKTSCPTTPRNRHPSHTCDKIGGEEHRREKKRGRETKGLTMVRGHICSFSKTSLSSSPLLLLPSIHPSPRCS